MENRSDMDELLILVDQHDKQTGLLDKRSVHERGLLHRAFSVFIFNSGGEILLQQRAFEKYHSPGIWSNTCCSHPRPGEHTADACKRRLMEEMGLECPLAFAFSFVYKFKFENGLTEHEYDHVYTGVSDEQPKPNAGEVRDWKYLKPAQLLHDIVQNPQSYSEWLKISLPRVLDKLQGKGSPYRLLLIMLLPAFLG